MKSPHNLHRAKMKTRLPYSAVYFGQNRFGLHTHAFFEIMVVLENGGKHWVNDQFFPMRRGDIYLLGPYHVHQGHHSKKSERQHFNLMFLAEAISSQGSGKDLVWPMLSPFLNADFPLPLRLPTPAFEKLLSLFELMVEEQKKAAMHSESIGAAILQIIVFTLKRHFPKSNIPNDSLALATLNVIGEQFQKPLTTEALAAQAGISSARLAQRFRKATGRTIKDALTERRLLEARRLLEGSLLNVTEVMSESGFNDLSYFNRAFKKSMGKSPRAYREAAKENNK